MLAYLIVLAMVSVFSGTDADLLTDVDLQSNRVKRNVEGGEVEFRACTRFQIEMLLIPLSIAMIPIALCALIMCTCCCGPKDSRGKLPDDFLSNFPMSKKRRIGSEEFELEFRDGYVQRKDSSKTKFSTVVSYIEARRESLWSVRTDGGASIISGKDADQNTEPKPGEDQTSPEILTDISALADRLRKVPSTESMKKTRFSDTVSVISAESLPRR
uniref:Transmembrane protein n=1 Tax=Heterorhabditis bacteriophora TaxID=37862 RepID=A0A1I7X9T8_HETBA